MSSRQEEKERRKAERIERERLAAEAAKRQRLVQIVGGAVVAAAVIAGIVFALGSGGGSQDRGTPAKLAAAATAAGCTARSFPQYGREHTTRKLTAKDFKTNPPTSGAHNPTPAADGIYDLGNEPEIGNWVHTLEHGRIILMYRRDVSKDGVAKLEELFNEPVLKGPDGYHMLLMHNNSNMPFPVAAVAWRHYVGCQKVDAKSLEAMRLFRDLYVDKAPEQIP